MVYAVPMLAPFNITSVLHYPIPSFAELFITKILILIRHYKPTIEHIVAEFLGCGRAITYITPIIDNGKLTASPQGAGTGE